MSAPVVDWIVLVPDHENALPKRMEARPSHLEGLKPRIDSGTWVMGGATAAAVPKEGEDKQFNGSCLVAKACSKEEVLEELRKDIYAQQGVWDLEKAQIYPLFTAFRSAL